MTTTAPQSILSAEMTISRQNRHKRLNRQWASRSTEFPHTLHQNAAIGTHAASLSLRCSSCRGSGHLRWQNEVKSKPYFRCAISELSRRGTLLPFAASAKTGHDQIDINRMGGNRVGPEADWEPFVRSPTLAKIDFIRQTLNQIAFRLRQTAQPTVRMRLGSTIKAINPRTAAASNPSSLHPSTST